MRTERVTKMNTLFRIFLCLGTLCLFAFLSIRKENEITAFRLQIPELTKEVKVLVEENTRLRFEKEQFESPENLLKIASTPAFSSLHFPIATNVSVFPKGFFLARNTSEDNNSLDLKAKPKLAYQP